MGLNDTNLPMSTDVYDAILEIAKRGYHIPFQARRNGVLSTYTIAEHFNLDLGWYLHDCMTQEIVSSLELQEVEIIALPPAPSPNAEVFLQVLKEREGAEVEFVFDLHNPKLPGIQP